MITSDSCLCKNPVFTFKVVSQVWCPARFANVCKSEHFQFENLWLFGYHQWVKWKSKCALQCGVAQIIHIVYIEWKWKGTQNRPLWNTFTNLKILLCCTITNNRLIFSRQTVIKPVNWKSINTLLPSMILNPLLTKSRQKKHNTVGVTVHGTDNLMKMLLCYDMV